MKRFSVNGCPWEGYLNSNNLNQNDFFNLSAEDRYEIWAEMPWNYLQSSITYGISQLLANEPEVGFNFFRFFMDLNNYSERRKAFIRLIKSWTQEKVEHELCKYMMLPSTQIKRPKSNSKPKTALALRVNGGCDVVLQ